MASIPVTINPIYRSGAMEVSSMVDTDAKHTLMSNAQTGKSYYPADPNPGGFDILEHELLWVRRTPADSDVLKVLSAVTGLGADCKAKVTATQDDADDFIKACMANQIQYIGVATNAVQMSDRLAQTNGVTVQVGGLNTLTTDNTGRKARPGDFLEAVLPSTGVAYRRTLGSTLGKQRLGVRPLDPASPGRMLIMHIRRILDNPGAWRRAMGNKLDGTNMWMTAASRVISSYLFAGTLLIKSLIENGVLQATPAMPGNPANGTDAAALLADYLRVLPSQTKFNALPAAQQKLFKEIRHNAAKTIFYGQHPDKKHINIFYEFGYATDNARYPNKGAIKTGTHYGDALDMQLNHLTMTVSAFHAAIQDQRRNIIGKAVTGENGKVIAALGIAS